MAVNEASGIPLAEPGTVVAQGNQLDEVAVNRAFTALEGQPGRVRGAAAAPNPGLVPDRPDFFCLICAASLTLPLTARSVGKGRYVIELPCQST